MTFQIFLATAIDKSLVSSLQANRKSRGSIGLNRGPKKDTLIAAIAAIPQVENFSKDLILHGYYENGMIDKKSGWIPDLDRQQVSHRKISRSNKIIVLFLFLY